MPRSHAALKLISATEHPVTQPDFSTVFALHHPWVAAMAARFLRP